MTWFTVTLFSLVLWKQDRVKLSFTKVLFELVFEQNQITINGLTNLLW